MKKPLPKDLECNRCYTEEKTYVYIVIEGTSSYDPTIEEEWLECPNCHNKIDRGDLEDDFMHEMYD